ncbi:hypothetical protein H6G89_27240 [Oscillatoria sp. FACHB-1407]|uniref:hypothetical protein n=1 Tax=Oscillatoria sp. FACHB-1407 TaxID=2692847 RepID=UPI0016830C2A|nr:hypothetical protein [Oscillatoria sp. FACHB-1407]MBD2464703.1 hypothetical protein [Oscillatoria sp. FACHB-1407]
MTQPIDQFLTVEESAEVDRAMMTSRDRFSARVAIYSLRLLKQIVESQGSATQNGSSSSGIADLHPQQIANWMAQDETLDAVNGADANFRTFFVQLVLSSLKPLKQIALEAGVAIEALTVSDVVQWFEKEAKIRIEQGNGATFLG